MGGKSRYNAMRSNQTEHFGIMGGLAPSTNVAAGGQALEAQESEE